MNETSRSKLSRAPSDLLWGAEEIGAFIKRNARQTRYMLTTGKLPATKVGNFWVTTKRKLIAYFEGEEEVR